MGGGTLFKAQECRDIPLSLMVEFQIYELVSMK